MQLEMHRMTRANGEMIAKNAALDAECARLRMTAQQETKKYAAKYDAILNQCNALQTVQREMNEAMQQERQTMANKMVQLQQEMQQHMQQKIQQETFSQRQSNLVEIVTIKRNLDARCAEFIANKTKELDAEKKALEDAIVAEKNARDKREEEHVVYFLDRMEEMDKQKAVVTAQLGEAKQKFEDECKQRREQLQMEQRALEAQHAQRMDEVVKMKVVVALQLEEAKKKFEDECNQRRDTDKRQQSELEAQRREEHAQRMDEVIKLKAIAAAQLEEANQQFEDECKCRREQLQMEQSQLEAQRRAQHAHRMEELDKQWALAAAQLEEAKQKFEDECKCRREQLQMEQKQIETQIHKYLETSDELTKKIMQTELERNGLMAEAEKRFEDHVKNHTTQLVKIISFSQMSHSIAANYAHVHMICHHLDFNQKRILIYSHYSEHDEVESYNYLTLEKMEDRFDQVIVLTNCPNKWKFSDTNYNKFHVLWYNFKSDFRNYAVFIMQAGKQIKRAAQLCLMNDSFVVVDVSAFERCMQRLLDPPPNIGAAAHDFMGITSSHEGVYHLQSYFMCFNARTLGAVVDYFDAHGLPINHYASISVYELGITNHLMNQGFIPFAMVSNQEMPVPLNTTHCKWSQVLQITGIVKRQHFLKQYPPRFAMTDLNIALVANKFSENKHFIHFLKYHGIKLD